ncbi:SRPBCC family protein [Jiangella sp. DSM 45060]|uniref:SRPBCC family protein n=1 Tax=Jiangella sp. DSM 45060 TaxID=1798224 RepID=UPI00087AF124|nr:SRPBCC family protein [Jiangella sp. DSM 45060]SDT18856.1 Carbon monoxide dehydrogenase subunit G [Jiangella sp. DSM 45060]
MEIENTFTVPVPVDEAWRVLLDVERVAPCMPGATLDAVDGDEFSGRVKAKVGPVSLSYKGRARIESADEESHTAVIAARGKDAHGNGTAAATVTMHLTDDAGAARVDLLTELDITGRPAQLGRGVMTDVANAIIGQFATALARQLAAAPPPSEPPGEHPGGWQPPGEPAPAGAATRAPAPALDPTVPEAIDVLGIAGRSVLRRMGAALARVVRRLFRRS